MCSSHRFNGCNPLLKPSYKHRQSLVNNALEILMYVGLDACKDKNAKEGGKRIKPKAWSLGYVDIWSLFHTLHSTKDLDYVEIWAMHRKGWELKWSLSPHFSFRNKNKGYVKQAQAKECKTKGKEA
jgi:hypothetical protein